MNTILALLLSFSAQADTVALPACNGAADLQACNCLEAREESRTLLVEFTNEQTPLSQRIDAAYRIKWLDQYYQCGLLQNIDALK